MTQRRRRRLTDEERQLWDQLAKTIAPLPQHFKNSGADLPAMDLRFPTSTDPNDTTPLGPQTLQAPRQTQSLLGPLQEVTPEALTSLWISGVGSAAADTGKSPNKPSKRGSFLPLEHGTSPGVDRRTANRFRKGRMVMEGRLDLHGMTQDQAHGALHRFIERASTEGVRCVLVITGKGARGEGVLRRMVPRWLNDARLRPLVLSFSHAQIPDGGDGALYILLKRRREEQSR